MKDVLISIKGTQVNGESTDVTEFTTEGKFSEKGDKTLLSYEESEALGVPGVTTYVRIENEKVVIQRSGKFNSRLLVEKNKRNLCHYETEYGPMMLGVFGEVITNKINFDGSLHMSYTLDVNCSMISRNEIEIKVKEVEN